MNGNISKEGIRLDLAWMHRVGIGGFQTFDAALRTPQIVPRRLVYMSPAWKDAFRYAVQLGKHYGMDMGIAASPGWSESGGPWVPPAEGMKKYVWSETPLTGGRRFNGMLAHPPQQTGPFADIPLLSGANAGPKPAFYQDTAFVAFEEPAAVTAQEQTPEVSASAGGLNLGMLNDGKFSKATYLTASRDLTAWVLFTYRKPQTISAMTYVTSDPEREQGKFPQPSAPLESLEASDDGVTFHEVAKLAAGRALVNTVSLPPTTAKYFRVTFQGPPHTPSNAQEPSVSGPPAYAIAELVLHSGPRVNHLFEKAAFVAGPDLYPLSTPPVDGRVAIASNSVVDVGRFVHGDGILDWTPPPGKWIVLRIGYSLTGITNHPATAEATGLEVDKLDGRSVERYFDHYLETYSQAVGSSNLGERGITNVVSDSWEAGSQNWTGDMLADFRRLRGYDPTPWLPVLAGRIVESAAASDGFLWDLRKTIADLIATEHYGQAEATLHARGLTHYGESHEGERVFIADGMQVKKLDDVPMGAMWVESLERNDTRARFTADDRESASVAHIYGQNLAAAESLTTANSPFAWSPATLKSTVDQEFLNGINRIFLHESTHQPVIGREPGLTLGKYGQWFNRNETWAEDARPWLDYLARCSFMLQQGRFAADLLYFYGEDTNITARFDHDSPAVPPGFNFDYVNADAMMHELTVSQGTLRTRSGMSYRLLVLDPYSVHMSLPVLETLHQLVVSGAIVVGPKPLEDPSLADRQDRFHLLADELFGDGTGKHLVGKGMVYAGFQMEDVLRAQAILPDFSYQGATDSAEIAYLHRSIADGEIYFLSNRSREPQTIQATFRVAGREPELWAPETGRITSVSFRAHDGQTSMPLHLGPSGSLFVVFRRPAQRASRDVPEPHETASLSLGGPWKVTFQPGRGAPPSITMPQLADWSSSGDPGVRYFSGAATYTSTFTVPKSWFARGGQMMIDLGDVRNLAVVAINGHALGTAWHAPFTLDATGALKPGVNTVQIRVTNAWVNRLIGDEQPNAVRYTWTDVKPYNANSPLLPSGLLGPVTLINNRVR